VPLRVHHVVDSAYTGAGSATVCVNGLIAELATRGIGSTLHHAYDDPHEQTIDATREADLVHLHGCTYEALMGAARIAKRLGRPCVISPAGQLGAAAIRRRPWGVRWGCKFYERRLIRGAAALLAQNQTEATALKERYGRDVAILPYGIDAWSPETERGSSEARIPDDLGGNCALMLSLIDPSTGCAAILKAVAQIGPDANGWHVVIAGGDRGGHKKMLEAAIRRKGGGDRVLLTSADDQAAQRALLDRADVLLAPALEPASMVSVLLAASRGVAILGTGSVVPDDLADSVVLCGASRAEIREGLGRIFTMTGEERSKLAAQAKRVFEERLCWRNLADRYVTLYNTIA